MGKWFAVFLAILVGAWWLGARRHDAPPGVERPTKLHDSPQSTDAPSSDSETDPSKESAAGPGATKPFSSPVVWQVIAPGVEFRALRLGESGTRLVALRVKPERVHLASGDTAVASDWRARQNALAAVNGGYFDDKDAPLGLRVTEGRELSPLRQADWGVFEVYRKGARTRARIVHSRDFEASDDLLEAVQCGPRLVVDGKVTDLKPQTDRRSGVGVTQDGHVVLAICDGPVSFERWAEMWRSLQGLGCRDALNLDGGGSTQFALNTPKRTLDIGGLWPVPDALVVK